MPAIIRGRLARKRQYLLHQVAGLFPGMLDHFKVAAIVLAEGAGAHQLGERDDRHQGIIEVVGDAPGESAERVEPLGMVQLLQIFVPRLLCLSGFGDILDRDKIAGRPAFGIGDDLAKAQNGPHIAVAPHDPVFALLAVIARLLALVIFQHLRAIVGMDDVADQVRDRGDRRACRRAKNPVHLLRPVMVAADPIDLAAADFGELLRTRKMRLRYGEAAPGFRAVARPNIGACAPGYGL